MDAALAALVERIRAASAAREPLLIAGGGSKQFYGNACAGTPLPTTALAGIVAYEPSELVIVARAGTPLALLEATLAERGQLLAFEPPHFGPDATVGGCVAAGLAGPRRVAAGPASGGVRDSLLGAKLVDGRGQLLAFGGTVMKNVAGFDVARALAGSLGTLGVIVEVALKVLPRPPAETTLAFECGEAEALARLAGLAARPLPLSASAWHDGVLRLRLSGAVAAVEAACRTLGGERSDGGDYWASLREQRLPCFAGAAPLWRLALPPTTPPLGLDAPTLIEWHGGQRWLRTTRPAAELRALATARGGHATLFRGGERAAGAFTPPPPALLAIQRRLQAAFDPARIFNRGRLYPED